MYYFFFCLSFRPEIGDTVTVKYEDEEAWARGVVVNTTEKGYVCALIDYGVIVSSNDVRELADTYKNIPEFTCVCRTDEENVKKIQQVR